MDTMTWKTIVYCGEHCTVVPAESKYFLCVTTNQDITRVYASMQYTLVDDGVQS